MKFLGIKFDCDKTQSSMGRLPMLGNIECFDNVGANEAFTVSAKAEIIADIKSTVSQMLRAQSVHSGSAASLRGRVLHFAATMPGKTGMEKRWAGTKESSWI